MYKKLLVLFVVAVMAVSGIPFVNASTGGEVSENGTGDSQQSTHTIQNYTIYSPPYDLSGLGWIDKDGLADATWATNSSTGYVGCAVDASGVNIGQGKARAVQPLEVKVGRGKKITVDASISYLSGDNNGEISKIWSYFDNLYEYLVVDPWFEWAEALITLIKIGSAIASLGTSLIFFEVVNILADVGTRLSEFIELAGDGNLSTTHTKFSYWAYPGDRSDIRVGLQSKAFYGGETFAVGYVKQIKVYGIAPPPEPTIEIVGDQPRDTETPYTFRFESIDPNNDPIKYEIDWGDGTSTETDFNITGEPTIEVTHSYAETGYYDIKVKAIDCDEMESGVSSKTIRIWNHKPVAKQLWVASSFLDWSWSTIGDVNVLPRYIPYRYGAEGYDKDGDRLNYTVRFIYDNTYRSDLIDQWAFEFTHTFTKTGTRYIEVTCWDEHGAKSDEKVFSIFVNPLIMNPSPANGAAIYASSEEERQDSTQVEATPEQEESVPVTFLLQTAYLNTQISQTTETSLNQDSMQVESTNIETSTSSTTQDGAVESRGITAAAQQAPNSVESSTLNGIRLSWDGAPHGYNMTYKIYFGTSSPSSLIGTTENTCGYHYSGTLTAGNTYYWKVVATDEYGGVTEGPVWHFSVSNDNNNDNNNSSDTQQINNAVSQPIEEYQTLV